MIRDPCEGVSCKSEDYSKILQQSSLKTSSRYCKKFVTILAKLVTISSEFVTDSDSQLIEFGHDFPEVFLLSS